MGRPLKVSAILTAVALMAGATGAVAQDKTLTFNCATVGAGPPEPLGDREGHAISVGQYSCVGQSGVLSGGVWTYTVVWEWDKMNAAIVSNAGVVRNPGSTTVVHFADGKIALTQADGKMSGAGWGHGVFPVAVGDAAALAGTSFAYSVKTTGYNQFTLEVTVE